MNNIRIAKQLIKIAKELVPSDSFQRNEKQVKAEYENFNKLLNEIKSWKIEDENKKQSYDKAVKQLNAIFNSATKFMNNSSSRKAISQEEYNDFMKDSQVKKFLNKCLDKTQDYMDEEDLDKYYRFATDYAVDLRKWIESIIKKLSYYA